LNKKHEMTHGAVWKAEDVNVSVNVEMQRGEAGLSEESVARGPTAVGRASDRSAGLGLGNCGWWVEEETPKGHGEKGFERAGEGF
jgi:hypothetical protein